MLVIPNTFSLHILHYYNKVIVYVFYHIAPHLWRYDVLQWFYRTCHACDAEITLILWWFEAVIKDPGTLVQWMFLMMVTFDLKLMGKTDCNVSPLETLQRLNRQETKRFSQLK